MKKLKKLHRLLCYPHIPILVIYFFEENSNHLHLTMTFLLCTSKKKIKVISIVIMIKIMIMIESNFSNSISGWKGNFPPSEWHLNRKSFRIQSKIEILDFSSAFPPKIRSWFHMVHLFRWIRQLVVVKKSRLKAFQIVIFMWQSPFLVSSNSFLGFFWNNQKIRSSKH